MTARCVGACGRAPVVLTDGELQRPDDRRADDRATGKVGGGMNIEELDQIAESVRLAECKVRSRDQRVHGHRLPEPALRPAEGRADEARSRLGQEVPASAAPAAWDCAPPDRWCWSTREETLYQPRARRAMRRQLSTSLAANRSQHLQCDLREHFDQQVHVVLENSGHIDPEKIDDYIARDGYQALVKALTEMIAAGRDQRRSRRAGCAAAAAAAIRPA